MENSSVLVGIIDIFLLNEYNSSMKTALKTDHSLKAILKRLRIKEIIAAVPPDIKPQFDQMQLENSIFRLKLLGVITVVFNALNWPVYLFFHGDVSFIFYRTAILADISHLFITILFFVLTNYFSKKSGYFTLQIMCYLNVIFNFAILAYSMLSVEIFLVLQVYFTGAFVYIFVPDFKPKIFISASALWYITLFCLLAYDSRSLAIGSPLIFALNIFLIAVVIKILLYNSNVRKYVNTYRIKELNEKLEALSRTDELTKLNNRRSFFEYLNTIWVLNRRLQTPVNILMIDVDYFKKYNDSLGHLEGDKVLVSITQCIRNQIRREADLIARFGGEEFVCLLPFLEKEDAFNLAKILVLAVEDMKIPHPASECSKYVTISIGLAGAIPDAGISQTQLLDEADKALYIAKKSGRNKVVAERETDILTGNNETVITVE
ncbi:MAG: GGDEF domain-containing protein [Treponema sp.]|nr:GGDEF domain-containing protein [Treponema sp.]